MSGGRVDFDELWDKIADLECANRILKRMFLAAFGTAIMLAIFSVIVIAHSGR